MIPGANNLGWHTRQAVPLQAAVTTASGLARIMAKSRQVFQFARQGCVQHVIKIQVTHMAARKLTGNRTRDRSRQSLLQVPHVPLRVWQRRSALLTLLLASK